MTRQAKSRMGTATEALRRMAESEPELAARMMLQSLPVAAAPTCPHGLSYRLELDELGAWRVTPNGDRAEVSEVQPGGELNGDAFAIETEPATLALLAAGANPLGAMARGRLKLRGKRRKALALRHLSTDAGPRELAKAGLPVDADLCSARSPTRSSPSGRGATASGRLRAASATAAGMDRRGRRRHRHARARRWTTEPESLVRIRYDDWLKLLSGEVTPSDSMRLG